MRVATGGGGGTLWWLLQRYTALVMLICGLELWLGYLFAPPLEYANWHGLFQKNSVRLLVWLLVASLCLHAWIGLRDVLIDYAKPLVVRIALNVTVALVLVLCIMWITVILWSGHG